MEDPLKTLKHVMLLSGISSVLLGLFLALITVWRRVWLRLLAREEAFWNRFGLQGNWLVAMKRFEESKLSVRLVAALLALHLFLLLFSGGAYAYFAPRLSKRPLPRPVPVKAPPRPSR